MRRIIAVCITFIAIIGFCGIGTTSGSVSLLIGYEKSDDIKPFIFKPVAKFLPSRDVGPCQIEKDVKFYMQNNTDKGRKFTAEMDYLGPTHVSYWSFVKFCFFGCRYDRGTSPAEISAGKTEEIAFQFAPPIKSEYSEFGSFAQSKLTIYATDDPSIKDEIYVATVHIPFMQITLPIDSVDMTIEKCTAWDPMNRDKTKRYPLEKEVTELDQPATIVNDRTYIPLRALAEEMYSEVDWDNKTKTASFTIGDDTAYYRMSLQIDNPVAVCKLKTSEGVFLEKRIEMPAPAIIRNGRTVVPVRSLGETLMGGEIDWLEETRTVMLYLPPRIQE